MFTLTQRQNNLDFDGQTSKVKAMSSHICSILVNTVSHLLKGSLRPKDKLIGVWWSDVKGQGRCDLFNKVFVLTQKFIS